MSVLRAILIGPENCLPDLKVRAAVDGDVLMFSEVQTLQALEAITSGRPSLVVLERTFAATPRGAALITRLKADPSLDQAEILVRAHDSGYARTVSRRTTTEAPGLPPAAAPSRPADWHGTRRTARHRMRDGVGMQVDGNPATVIDLSPLGAQIVSPTSLRPNQRVRLLIADDVQAMRFGATIAWASFEMSEAGPRYRAGLEFRDADPAILQTYCDRHRVA